MYGGGRSREDTLPTIEWRPSAWSDAYGDLGRFNLQWGGWFPTVGATVNAVCPCGSGKSPRLVGNYYGCDTCHPWAQSASSKFPLFLGRIPDYVPEKQ